MIERILEENVRSKLRSGKAIIIMGARQVGKTTLLRQMFKDNSEVLWLSGDEMDIQALFAEASATRLKAYIGNYKILIIDEAQRIQNIGLRLKLITDNIPDIQLIATGGSSFELANRVNEPLTGRKWQYKMYPISFAEMVNHHGLLEEKRLLKHRMIYGYYPKIVKQPGNEKELLKQLTDSYLYKDILAWESIQKPQKLLSLLRALAFQVGSQVSFHELAQLCSLSSKTVEKYIDLLQKTYVIFRLGSYSRNLRNELKKSKKFYFYDNGIRNALIADFRQVENRNDIGALWENFLVAERIKHNDYSGRWVNAWYWRTKEQKEIDFVEESDGVLNAYEFKWKTRARIKPPQKFLDNYESTYSIIHRENYDQFLMDNENDKPSTQSNSLRSDG